ncbi:DoxX family membrane protein [Actinopolymorpha sp. B9G3]|uniref:DoxX family protein n=1 Tax=Actinopolymorpha sp. B9G3 TaxID=3158970 RepID=UPI0032D9190C
MTLVRMLARPMLAAIFVVQGVRAIKNPDALVPRAKPFADQIVPTVKRMAPDQVARRVPENPRTLVRLNGIVHLVGGLALATGQGRRAGACLLAASMVPTTMAGHPYWEEDDPAQRANQQIHFLKNLAMMGGLLLAAVDTEGKPGLWWRARYSARDAKKASKRLSKAARREAHLAAKVAEHQAHLAAKTAMPFKSGKSAVASAGATAAKALHTAKSGTVPHGGKSGRHSKRGMFGKNGVLGKDGLLGKRGRAAKPTKFGTHGRDAKHGKDGMARRLVTSAKA